MTESITPLAQYEEFERIPAAPMLGTALENYLLPNEYAPRGISINIATGDVQTREHDGTKDRLFGRVKRNDDGAFVVTAAPGCTAAELAELVGWADDMAFGLQGRTPELNVLDFWSPVEND